MIKTKRKFDFNVYAIIIVAVTIALLMALFIGNKIALMITTPLFVVTLCAISSIVGARMMTILSGNFISGLKLRHGP